jgi:hypothetical protein
MSIAFRSKINHFPVIASEAKQSHEIIFVIANEAKQSREIASSPLSPRNDTIIP